MLAGGILLTLISAGLGEFRGFQVRNVSGQTWFALAYLVGAGSILAYTVYIWLIHHESPTKVGTYAYVNPVVAVILGYFLGGEGIGPRTLRSRHLLRLNQLIELLAGQVSQLQRGFAQA